MVASESDEELEEEEKEGKEVKAEDMPLEPSLVHTEFVPRIVERKLQQIFSKGRTLICALQLQLKGCFTIIGSCTWDTK